MHVERTRMDIGTYIRVRFEKDGKSVTLHLGESVAAMRNVYSTD